MKTKQNKIFLLGIFFIGIIVGTLVQMFLMNASSSRNVVTDKAIYWSNEWQNGETSTTGSEFSFAFTGSRSIAFRVQIEEKLEPIELVFFIDGKEYLISNPNINDKRLEVVIPEDEKNKKHTVRGAVYCMTGLAKCKIQVTEISLSHGEVQPWNEGRPQKTVGILGDSISLIHLKDNYSAILSRSLNAHVYNASYWGRTVGREKGVHPAVLRYKQDLIDYKPDVIIVFLGTNDVYYFSSIESFRKDYVEIITGIQKDLPQTKILTVSILPGKEKDSFYETIIEFNEIIKSIANKYNVVYIDSMTWLTEEDYGDQIHPNARGEAKIAEYLYAALSKMILQ